jgi:superfamily I DNA/RNA helicase
MNDHTLPNYRVDRIRDATERDSRLAEFRRIAYVDATRAKRVLVFISDTRVRNGGYQNLPSRFLTELGF